MYAMRPAEAPMASWPRFRRDILEVDGSDFIDIICLGPALLLTLLRRRGSAAHGENASMIPFTRKIRTVSIGRGSADSNACGPSVVMLKLRRSGNRGKIRRDGSDGWDANLGNLTAEHCSVV